MQSGRTFRKNILPPSSVSKCEPSKQVAVHGVTFQKTALRVEIRGGSFSFYKLKFQRETWGIRTVNAEPLLVRIHVARYPVTCLETLIRTLNSVAECL